MLRAPNMSSRRGAQLVITLYLIFAMTLLMDRFNMIFKYLYSFTI
jgi:hypothetical protein